MVQWLRTFPSMMESDIVAREQYLKDGYYVEINCVKIREMANKPFLVWTMRRYNWEDKDYSTHVHADEEKEILSKLFGEEIDEFCAKNGMGRGF